jgi:TolA-binding protein
MKQQLRWQTLSVALLALLGPSLDPLPVSAQATLTPDDAALMLLHSAQRAFNEKNFAFARDRFREFLQKHGGRKEANSARYGLALSLLEGPEKDYNAALEPLQQLTGLQDFVERPFAVYYLGLALRGLGLQALAQSTKQPNEAAQQRNNAHQRFEQAAQQFATAVTLFATANPEWAARARCDQAEMFLRANKSKEALAATEPFLKDAGLAKSRYRLQGVYHHGHAAFQLQDHVTAGRSLSQIAPFTDPVFGGHARYLLGRVHHLSDERPEAASHYEAVLTHHEQQKKAASQALQNPAAFKDNFDEKLRLESLVKDPPPDHVARAAYFWAVLQFEDGKFADAQARLAAFAQQFPGSPLIPDAQLRLGFCQVQQKQFAEAIKTLQPLEQLQPRFADQVMWWIAKAQVGAAEPGNPALYEQALKPAVETFRRAADRANQLAANEPEAKLRRGEILLELADTQQLLKQHKEAAAVYQQVQQENLVPERAAEAMQRQATALHLAGQFADSDQVCQRFFQIHGKSPLVQPVLFRLAENAFLTAVAAANRTDLPDRDAELKRLFGEAIKRYQHLIEKHPEFPQVNLARQGMGLSHYRLGDWEKAATALAGIPAADRVGDLVAVPFVQADCLLRLLPAEANDAIAAARVQVQLSEATKLLDGFVNANAQHPQVPDALIRLGHCHQRLGELFAGPQERNQAYTAARLAYERLLQQFANHASVPVAVFERAKTIAAAGEVNGAINELNRFQNDPLRQSVIAPVALVRLATLLRSQNRLADALKVLEQCRAMHEANLLKEPSRLDVAVLVRFHQGLLLKDLARLPEARGVFESIIRDFPNRAEAPEAAWRVGQCRKDEAVLKFETAAKNLTKPGAKPEEVAAANASLQEGLKQLREAAQFFEDQAKQLQPKAPASENHLRMLYEAAWCCRRIGMHEIEQTRHRLQAEGLKKLHEERQKQAQGTQALPALRPPDISLAAIPIQPAEQKARELYKSMIAAAGDAPLALDARLELAELLAERNELDPAIQLLLQALEKDASSDMADRLRFRLGAIRFAKGDPKAAFVQFDPIAQNAKSPLAPEARYRAAECLIQQATQSKELWAKAIEHLQPFRDQQPLQNLPGISDRALLRLSHALAQIAQWDQSRQASEILLQRFPQSPWVHDARYAIGWAWQNQKNIDAAVSSYTQVTAGTAAEVAARAQLQIGLCRLEQKRHAEAANALLVVPFTYDYPELSALALCEASRAFLELRQGDHAAKLLERVVMDHAGSRWAEVARQRLAELQASSKKRG